MQRKIRLLVGKPGLDGHDRGAKVVAAALRDAGMEVIYTGLHQSPEQIVEAALQEDVDVVALSVLSGAHMTLFPEVMKLMQERGIGERLLTGGGIIPPEDMATLAGMGVGRLFGPGSSTQDIVEYIRSWYAGRHGIDALPPLPPRRDPESMHAASASGRRHATPAAAPARATSRARAQPKARRSRVARPAASRAKSAGSRVTKVKRATRAASTARRPKARAKKAARRR